MPGRRLWLLWGRCCRHSGLLVLTALRRTGGFHDEEEESPALLPDGAAR